MPVDVNMKGIQKVQHATNVAINALKPRHALGKALKEGTAMTRRFAVHETPTDTGALAASHREKIELRQIRGRVSIDRAAINRRGQRPAEYGYYLHQRGHRAGLERGWQDFYAHVYNTRGMKILRDMAEIIRKALP